MPHERKRHAVEHLRKLAALWPAVGVVGPRQVGKSTLVRNQLGISRQYTLDDEDTLGEIEASAKVFVARLNPPVLIDEVQKAPKLFDALKARIDRKRIPGQFYLTGSAQFSSRLGIRESLTGRIGLFRLHPLTLAEVHQKPLLAQVGLQNKAPRFSIDEFSSAMERGGLPFPAFLRDPQSVQLYWQSWLDTTVYRDIARFFKSAYDPRITMRILNKLRDCALNGGHFQIADLPSIQSRRLHSYLQAMEEAFLLRRLSCHEDGVGKDQWMLFDSGLLYHLFAGARSEGATLSLARTFLFNELSALAEYSGRRTELTYFKSSRGKPVDLVWDGIPIKLITSTSLKNLGWQTRALHGAMKALGVHQAAIVAPVSKPVIEKRGISILPWSYWS